MSSVEALGDELLGIISAKVLGHERSNQTMIGPSGLGTPCDRKLAFRLLQVPPLEAATPAWRPTVGTAVHSWLELAMTDYNEIQLQIIRDQKQRVNEAVARRFTGNPRFLTEQRLLCGTIDGEEIWGTADVYDRATKTIIDWKVCGPGKLKEYRAHGPSAEYRVQGHVYGRGAAAAGMEVEHVAWMFLPMNGELREAAFHHEPYDPEIGNAAFRRARGILTSLDGVDFSVTDLDVANDFCQYCPWWAPGDEASDTSCPGALPRNFTTPSIEEMLS